jgi:hypothetical protein
MTRKDYALLAEALHHSKPIRMADSLSTNIFQWEQDVRAIATALRTANIRFDRDKFLRACGIDNP